MFLIIEPDEKSIARFIEKQCGESFSYSEIGFSRSGNAPDGYNIDHNRIQIGTGEGDFRQAIKAVKNWKMFDLNWVKLYPNTTPIEVGETVAIIIKHFGFWSLNAARIVYVFEKTDGDIEKYGFAYGTLTEHGERGEERFSVELHKKDESVWYDLYAFSQPKHLLAKLGYPFSRMLQKQFAAESKLAMKKAVKDVRY
ncbi:MAG: DUF1990 domain-containing protein [Acidobacteriota bacterium]